MTCDEAAEFVSVLCDGETIPRAAAEHVGTCASCQARLEEYMEMGAELRLTASLAIKESVSPRVWNSPQSTFPIWWQKGWGTMRIPRLAFAILIAAIVALGSTLAVVKVRAHSDGTVVMLKIARPEGNPVGCPLSTEDKNQATCAFIGQMNGKIIGYRIDLISREGDRVELAVRTKTFGPLSGTFSLSDIQNEPQKQIFFEPGQTVKLDVDGSESLTVTGEWFDHMPAFIGSSSRELDPGPKELRLVSPVLLSDKQVLGDLEGGSAIVDKTGQGVEIYMPGEGRFVLSLSPMQGAVQARVALNRISFQDGGRSYAFLTGSPVTGGEHIWVLHEAHFKRLDQAGDNAFIGSGYLQQLVPGAMIPAETNKN
ncbi:MAG TPA: hypothetical protein VHT24_13145 [Pseudacidobacterium sp.]|jgi:hypothetical protein|nr:hypothetical protein [Pseudacidobacterium sp.]